jgi:RNA polymerase sigma-70 factor, ECF subfamily
MFEITDKQLLEQFFAGEHAAFELLFERHYQRVLRAAYGLLGSHAAAEDAAQEAFVALYRRPPSLEDETSLIGWLCRVASNRSMNMLRSERRELARLGRIDVLDEPDPAERIVQEEAQRELRAALASLPERQIQILVLRYAGLSYAEIAEAIGVAASSVGTLLARAERALRLAFQQRTPAALAHAE